MTNQDAYIWGEYLLDTMPQDLSFAHDVGLPIDPMAIAIAYTAHGLNLGLSTDVFSRKDLASWLRRTARAVEHNKPFPAYLVSLDTPHG